MKERINWIDWAKALAVASVVFCHLPQSQEWFYYRYLLAVTIVIFIFLSDYLKKDRGSDKENWKKYWHGLIVPYILYNAIVYPYWLAKFYLQHGNIPDLLQALRPIFGASLLLFAWHLDAFFGGQHLLHIILFYPVNIGFLFGVMYGCKLVDRCRSSIVTNLSIGTLVIIGLHIVAVTIANYAIGYLFDIKEGICYQWYEALPVTLVIVALLYPIILFAKKHCPVLIGRNRVQISK